MGALTESYAEHVLRRLAKLDQTAKPRWGSMTAAQMVGHLTQAVRYTLGEGPDMPFRGNWKTRYVFRPFILSQLLALPRNVRLPNPDGSRTRRVPPDGSVAALRDAMDTYLRRCGGFPPDPLPPRVHPFFGMMSARAWRRFHYAHFEHHLSQFNL